MKLQLLLPLVLAACLQAVDPASQDASGDKSKYNLMIAEQKVVDEKNNDYGASITEMKLAKREGFGNPVELQKDEPLHDNSPLVFTSIKFNFATKQAGYECMMMGENMLLRHKIPFTAGKCGRIATTQQQATYHYGKYVLKGNDGEMRRAVKIGINTEGLPSKMYSKNLKSDYPPLEADLTQEWELPNSPNQLWIGYVGEIAEHKIKFLVKYPENTKEIAKMIGNKLPALVHTDSGKEYKSTKESHVITASAYKLLAAQNLSEFPDLETWFNTNCRQKVGLTDPKFSHTMSGIGGGDTVEIGDRVYAVGNTLAIESDSCPVEANRSFNYNLHGIAAPRVVKYLKDCKATCSSTNKYGLVIKLDGHSDANITEDCSGKSTAFYVEDERLYLVNIDNKIISTFWINCAENTTGEIK